MSIFGFVTCAFEVLLKNNILAYTNVAELLLCILLQSFHRLSLTCKSSICFELVVLCNWWKMRVSLISPFCMWGSNFPNTANWRSCFLLPIAREGNLFWPEVGPWPEQQFPSWVLSMWTLSPSEWPQVLSWGMCTSPAHRARWQALLSYFLDTFPEKHQSGHQLLSLFKNCYVRAGELAQWLSGLTLTKDHSSVVSTHFEWLPNTWNFSSGGSNALSGFCGHLHATAQTLTQAHIPLHKLNSQTSYLIFKVPLPFLTSHLWFPDREWGTEPQTLLSVSVQPSGLRS